MTELRSLEPADLYRLRLVSDPRIAPDGSRIAFVLKQMDEEKNEYVSNIYVVDRQGAVTQFTSGGKDSAPRWSPDGRFLAFLSARDEKAQIRLLPASGGESIALTDRPLGAGIPFWSPDSTAIVFTGPTSTDPEEEKPKEEKDTSKPAKTKVVTRASYKLDGAGYIGNRRRHLFRIDVAERRVEQLTEGDFHDDEPAWSPDSRHVAFSSSRIPRWDVTIAGDIYVIPREGGEARKVVSGNFDNPFFSPDGSRIGFIGREDAEDIVSPPRLYSADRSGGDLRDELGAWDGTLGDWNISDVMVPDQPIGTPQWRGDGIYFLGTIRGEANVFRARNGKVKTVTQGAHTVIGFSLADDGALAFARGDATHLADVFVRQDGEDRQLTHENEDTFREIWLATPERFRFTGANGEESEGWLLAPRCHQSGKKPLIVYLHGGPQFAHGEAFFFEYQFLAGQGFGVFYPNIHGSTSYGRDYQRSIRADWGNLDFQDVLAGTEAAASRPWIDANRLGIAGGSYGGYITLWTISHSDRFSAALAERCLSNFVSFIGTSDSGWIWDRITGAFPEDDVEKLWAMSPMKHIANITAPVLVMHSERDDRTPIEQGEQVFLGLRRLGRDTKLIMFPEESHGLTRMGKPSRRVERLGYVLEWFREKL